VGRFSVFVVAVLLAVTSAAIGLFGNASFSTDVPVRVPSRATLLDRTGRPTPVRAPLRDQHSDRRSHPGADRESLRSGRGSRAEVRQRVGPGAGGQP
jgi:hypothetical protein